jgi:hypothetical protein
MEASWVVETLDCVVCRHGRPEIIISNQVELFSSNGYVILVKVSGIQLMRVGIGRAIGNMIAER